MLFVQYGAVKCSAVQCSAVQWYIASVQVRKTSQAALLVLLEQGLADIQDVEEQVTVGNIVPMADGIARQV